MNLFKLVVFEFMKNLCVFLIRIKFFVVIIGVFCRMIKWLIGNKFYIECFEMFFVECVFIVLIKGILNYGFE